jgi:IS5 family transposase
VLRIYFMQNWFNLSGPQVEASLYDVESMGRFAGIEPQGRDIPDESTILRFRHLVEQRLLLKSGTIMGATLIAAPPSTKNEQSKRDPEMHQARKGKDWHFGMKARIGTDRRGIVHSLCRASLAHRCTQTGQASFAPCSSVGRRQYYMRKGHDSIRLDSELEHFGGADATACRHGEYIASAGAGAATIGAG